MLDVQRAHQSTWKGFDERTRAESDGPATEEDGQDPLARADGVWRIGSYAVLRRIGEGGMGQVFAAYDEALDRKVAIKVLRSDLRRGAEAATRMLREAQALARLSHPNVVQVYEVGKVGGRGFIAMEYIDGADGRAWLLAQRRTWQETLAVYLQAGQGLAAAHRAGLVHRDFKPDNLLIGANGRVCVGDFGLVRSDEAVDEASSGDVFSPESTHDVALTAANTVLGTPAYMSPEQHLLVPVDARSDQYSFCVALYEAFFGIRPFGGTTLEEIRSQVMRGQLPAPPPRSEVPHRVRRALLRGLALLPEDRWPTMDMLLAALAARPARRWALGLVGVLLTGVTVGALALGLPQVERCTGAEERVATVWNEARREAIRAGIVGTGLPFATHAADRVAQTLDEYAASWTSMSTEACQTHQRGEQSDEVFDRRVRCLEHRRADLDAMAEVLGEVGEDSVEKAAGAATSLPPLSGCADVMALMDEPAPPAELLDGIEETGAELGRARASRAAGNAAAALERAQRALGQARTMAYPPLVAEALHEAAHAEFRLGRYDDAFKHGDEAFQLALAGAQDVLAAKIAIHQLNVAVRLGRLPVGETWVLVAKALLERGRVPDVVRVDFHEALAALYNHIRPREVRETFTQAVALAEKHAGPGIQARIHQNFGRALIKLGEPVVAKSHLERALALTVSEHGAHHPRIALIRANLAGALAAVGEAAGAEAEYRSAIDHCARARDAMHPVCGTITGDLAVHLAVHGRFTEARPLFERWLRIIEAQSGSEHQALAMPMFNMGCLLLELGEPAKAHAHLTRALAIQERFAGPDTVDGGSFLTELGRAEIELGRPAVARPLLERALALRERLEVVPREIAETRFHLARALWSVPADRARAIELGRQAEAGLGKATIHAAAAAWLAERGITPMPREPSAKVE